MRRDSIDRFRLMNQLGSGAFGVVYQAYDEYRNRVVALKVLEHARPEALYRFKQEFRILSELRHRNLVSLYELLMVNDKWMFSMEIIHGADLLEHLALAEIQQTLLRQQLPTLRSSSDASNYEIAQTPARSLLTTLYTAQIRETFRQLATGIAVLHSRNIIHRDIKPSNVLITIEGRVVLLDFGLVIELTPDSFDDPTQMIGTPGYMSPEQITGSSVGPASDWYSVGVVLFQALTGTLPFFGTDAREFMRLQRSTDAAAASSIVDGVPEDLDLLCRDLLRRDPADRPPEQEILSRFGVVQFGGRLEERTRKRTTFLIGRDEQLETLTRLAETLDGPRTCLIHGSPGIGKTALLDTYLHNLRIEGSAVILGSRCYERETVPFKTVDGLLDSLTRYLKRQTRERIIELIPKNIASLSKFFPVLGTVPHIRRMERDRPGPAGPSENEASSALGQILCAIAQKDFLIVVLEDVHWGDLKSAEMLLGAFTELDSNCNYLCLACYRTEDAPTSLFLQILRPSLRSTPMVLPLLSDDDARQIAQRLVHDIPDNTKLVDSLVRESKGNPLLMEMVVELVRGSTQPLRSATLADALNDILAGQSTAARRLFEVILVADGPIESSIALRTAGIFEGDEPLRALSRARLVRSRWTGNLEELIVFHPQMQATLRGSIEPARASAILLEIESVLSEY